MKTKQLALEALETAKNGLLWFVDSFPASQSGSDDEAIAEIDKAIAALEADIAQPVQPGTCRSDGRCQYAIDHGAEDLGHCPVGKCVQPVQPAPQAVNAELLEALESVVRTSGRMPITSDPYFAAAMRRAVAVIAKATGEKS